MLLDQIVEGLARILGSVTQQEANVLAGIGDGGGGHAGQVVAVVGGVQLKGEHPILQGLAGEGLVALDLHRGGAGDVVAVVEYHRAGGDQRVLNRHQHPNGGGSHQRTLLVIRHLHGDPILGLVVGDTGHRLLGQLLTDDVVTGADGGVTDRRKIDDAVPIVGHPLTLAAGHDGGEVALDLGQHKGELVGSQRLAEQLLDRRHIHRHSRGLIGVLEGQRAVFHHGPVGIKAAHAVVGDADLDNIGSGGIGHAVAGGTCHLGDLVIVISQSRIGDGGKPEGGAIAGGGAILGTQHQRIAHSGAVFVRHLGQQEGKLAAHHRTTGEGLGALDGDRGVPGQGVGIVEVEGVGIHRGGGAVGYHVGIAVSHPQAGHALGIHVLLHQHGDVIVVLVIGDAAQIGGILLDRQIMQTGGIEGDTLKGDGVAHVLHRLQGVALDDEGGGGAIQAKGEGAPAQIITAVEGLDTGQHQRRSGYHVALVGVTVGDAVGSPVVGGIGAHHAAADGGVLSLRLVGSIVPGDAECADPALVVVHTHHPISNGRGDLPQIIGLALGAQGVLGHRHGKGGLAIAVGEHVIGRRGGGHRLKQTEGHVRTMLGIGDGSIGRIHHQLVDVHVHHVLGHHVGEILGDDVAVGGVAGQPGLLIGYHRADLQRTVGVGIGNGDREQTKAAVIGHIRDAAVGDLLHHTEVVGAHLVKGDGGHINGVIGGTVGDRR